MNTKEAAELNDDINRMSIWLRKPSARELGKRLRVTNQMRQQWRLWTVAPYDMTDEELAEQRRAKDRERKRRRRERQREGGATRAQWLAAHSINRDKPWLLLGISRASYYRKLAKDNPPQVRQVPSAMKLKQHRTQPCLTEQASRQQGCPGNIQTQAEHQPERQKQPNRRECSR
jgi:hypothetical protein